MVPISVSCDLAWSLLVLDVQAVDDRILLIVVAVERKNPDDVLRFQRMVCSALPS